MPYSLAHSIYIVASLILFIIAIIQSVSLKNKAKAKVSQNQTSNEALTSEEKKLVWIWCFLSPLVSGAIFYYGYYTNF